MALISNPILAKAVDITLLVVFFVVFFNLYALSLFASISSAISGSRKIKQCTGFYTGFLTRYVIAQVIFGTFLSIGFVDLVIRCLCIFLRMWPSKVTNLVVILLRYADIIPMCLLFVALGVSMGLGFGSLVHIRYLVKENCEKLISYPARHSIGPIDVMAMVVLGCTLWGCPIAFANLQNNIEFRTSVGYILVPLSIAVMVALFLAVLFLFVILIGNAVWAIGRINVSVKKGIISKEQSKYAKKMLLAAQACINRYTTIMILLFGGAITVFLLQLWFNIQYGSVAMDVLFVASASLVAMHKAVGFALDIGHYPRCYVSPISVQTEDTNDDEMVLLVGMKWVKRG